MVKIRKSHIVHGEEGRFGTPDRLQGQENIFDVPKGVGVSEILGDFDAKASVVFARTAKRKASSRIASIGESCILGARLSGALNGKNFLIELFSNSQPEREEILGALLESGAELLIDEDEVIDNTTWVTAGFPVKKEHSASNQQRKGIISFDDFDFDYTQRGSKLVYDGKLSKDQADETARFIYFTAADETARSLCLSVYRALRVSRYEWGRQVSTGIDVFTLDHMEQPTDEDVDLFSIHFDKLRSQGEVAAKICSKRSLAEHPQIVEAQKKAGIIADYEAIWEHALKVACRNPENNREYIDQAEEDIMNSEGDDIGREYISSLARLIGVDHMVDAYLSGVPVEYIVAGTIAN